MAPLVRAVRRAVRSGGALEGPLEAALYLLGWVVWPLDWLLRLPALARYASVGLAPGGIACRGTLLLRHDAGPPPPSGAAGTTAAAVARATMLLRGADALLREHGVALAFEPVGVDVLEEGLEPPSCGLAALVGRFFGWASARALDPPGLTVYFVENLGRYAGCAVPGADWIVVDLRTDSTTIVHEIGHLADLWPHSGDPANVMTNRPGGRHDRLTPLQAGLIRTSRFASRAPSADRGAIGRPTRSGS